MASRGSGKLIITLFGKECINVFLLDVSKTFGQCLNSKDCGGGGGDEKWQSLIFPAFLCMLVYHYGGTVWYFETALDV